MKQEKDRHQALPYTSRSVGELKKCLTPYIPFGVTYHPWLDLVGYSFKSGTWEGPKNFKTGFGSPKVTIHKGDGWEKWVRTFQSKGSQQIDLETFKVGRFLHGYVFMYDNPSPELKSQVHHLMAGTDYKLSKLEFGVDLKPNTPFG